jgi:hypothetical protein
VTAAMAPGGLLALALVLGSPPQGASSKWNMDEPLPSFEYVEPRRKYWLRMTLEEFVLLVLGEIQYQLTNPFVHYTLDYAWKTAWEKATWQRLAFDDFPFDNDQLSHPGAGVLTYFFARSNGFGMAASSIVTVASATLWKHFGELREDDFVNSIITTSVAGTSIGESGSQLAAFFDAGSSTPLTQTLSFLFNPVRKVHDWIDGAQPLRTPRVDGLGLSRDVGHELRVWGGPIVTWTSSSEGPGRTNVDAAMGFRSRVVNLPGYDDPGRFSQWWYDGNESGLTADFQLGGGRLDDVYLLARVMPVGWFVKRVNGKGDEREGQRFWVGPAIGFEYALHDYDHADNGAPPDRFSTSQLGAQFEHDFFFRHGRLRTGFAMQGQFGPVQSLALSRYLATAGSVAPLPAALRDQGYYWCWGLGAMPVLDLHFGTLRAGGLARLDQFGGTYAIQPATRGEVTLHDWSVVADAWLGMAPIAPLELAVVARRRARLGDVDGTTVSRAETSLLTTVRLEF